MADDKGARGTDGGNVSDDATDDQNQGDPGGDDQGDKVSLATHKKLLSEKKAMQARLKDFESKFAELENGKLEAEGKKDELLQKLRADLDKVTKTHKETLNNFISQSLDAQVEALAAKMGAVDVDLVRRAIDLSEVEVDPKSFKADAATLETAMNELKKAKPILFNKSAPKVNARMPTGTVKMVGDKALKEMSDADLMAELRRLK